MDKFMLPITNKLVRFENTIELARLDLEAEVQLLLGACNELQQAFFAKIYPEGLGEMTVNDLQCAFDLCLRTVAENRTGQTNKSSHG
jgi:hypothetical protein